MKTTVYNPATIERKWFVIDARDMVLGRLASKVASLLIGKSKPRYSPNQDHGDNVIVINSDKVFLSGRKPITKRYFRHSTWPGGGKSTPYKDQMEHDSTEVIKHAVHGMVAKNTLGKAVMKKLHVYAGETHPHASQKPQTISA